VPHVLPSVRCPLWTPQGTDAFNQPLNFDTSSVTDMSHMFAVRFRLRLPECHTPELGHTHPFPPCYLRATRLFPLPGTPFGLGSMRMLSTSR